LPTGALADEILLEGDGQIRALFCLGGNPLTAWPDQIKTRAALEKLDLLVVLDPKMNQTARYADYVIPPKLVPEIPALSYDFEELETHSPGWGYPVPYAAYREALVDPPEGSELLEDWELFYYLAREMKLPLQVYFGLLRDPGDPEGRFVSLDMENKPTTDDFFEMLTEGSRIPLSEVRKHEAGRLYEDPDAFVLPRDPDCTSYLELGNPIMMEQLDEALQQGALPGDEEFPFRLLSRRQKHTLNSLGRDQAELVRERPHNPLFMHPEDMARIGVTNGKIVAITSRRATIHAVVEASDELREGVVSMSHAYGIDLDRLKPGADPAEPQEYSMGNHTGALASADLDYQEPYTGIPRMSSIPVHVTPGP
jgi:anaerobic selenocysteine-containing dehydrogenase